MKKHLLIFFLAALLVAGLNERNRTGIASIDFSTPAPTATISQKDDSGVLEAALEANSIFALPSVNNSAPACDNPQNFRMRYSETIAFTPVAAAGGAVVYGAHVIACNGAFNRPSDYYVYALRRIVV